MGNNATSKQSTGKIFTTEKLLINFDAEVPAEANPNDEIVVKESARQYVATYFTNAFKDDEDKWKALAKGDSVQTVDKAAAVKNLYSQWQLSETERMTVYNPIMKDSPVKVTRINDVVYINVWVEKNATYMQPMQTLYSSSGAKLPRSKNIWDIVIEAFKFWEGKYIATKNVDSFDSDPEIHVEALIHDNPVAPQRYVTIVVHDKWPVPPNEKEFTYATPLDSGSNKMGIYTDWSTHMEGFIINACNWYRFESKTGATTTYKDQPFDDVDFKCAFAHEVGHLLGLAEAYDLILEDIKNKQKISYSVDDSSKEVPPEDIMRDGTLSTRKITPNDIEMILKCWMEEGELQLFYDIAEAGEAFTQSKVIKTAPDKSTIIK